MESQQNSLCVANQKIAKICRPHEKKFKIVFNFLDPDLGYTKRQESWFIFDPILCISSYQLRLPE